MAETKRHTDLNSSHEQGSGHLPDPSTPERRETRELVERAREANRQHETVNRQADAPKPAQGTRQSKG